MRTRHGTSAPHRVFTLSLNVLRRILPNHHAIGIDLTASATASVSWAGQLEVAGRGPPNFRSTGGPHPEPLPTMQLAAPTQQHRRDRLIRRRDRCCDPGRVGLSKPLI